MSIITAARVAAVTTAVAVGSYTSADLAGLSWKDVERGANKVGGAVSGAGDIIEEGLDKGGKALEDIVQEGEKAIEEATGVDLSPPPKAEEGVRNFGRDVRQQGKELARQAPRTVVEAFALIASTPLSEQQPDTYDPKATKEDNTPPSTKEDVAELVQNFELCKSGCSISIIDAAKDLATTNVYMAFIKGVTFGVDAVVCPASCETPKSAVRILPRSGNTTLIIDRKTYETIGACTNGGCYIKDHEGRDLPTIAAPRQTDIPGPR